MLVFVCVKALSGSSPKRFHTSAIIVSGSMLGTSAAPVRTAPPVDMSWLIVPTVNCVALVDSGLVASSSILAHISARRTIDAAVIVFELLIIEAVAVSVSPSSESDAEQVTDIPTDETTVSPDSTELSAADSAIADCDAIVSPDSVTDSAAAIAALATAASVSEDSVTFSEALMPSTRGADADSESDDSVIDAVGVISRTKTPEI